MKMKDILLCILFVLSVVEAKTLKPSVLAQEGDAAEIVCPTLESYESYFWRKGDSIHDSTEVASFVDGVPRADSKNYAITANATLCIKNVTPKDEGNYFCRGVSVNSSVTIEIMVYVQASPPNFELSIDHCGTESSCLQYINLSEPIELICRAKNASPSMMLKWFNGSREIESSFAVVNLYEKDVPSSTTIRSTIIAVYGTPVTLICQAVDTKSRTDCGRFVNIRLEQPVPITNEKPPAPDQDLVEVRMITEQILSLLYMLMFMLMLLVMVMLMAMAMHRSERDWQNGRPSVPNNGSVPIGLVPIGSNQRLSCMSEEK